MNSSFKVLQVLVLSGGVLLSSCGDEGGGAQSSKVANPSAAEEALLNDGRDALAYDGDIAPILASHCTSCHSSYGSYGGAADEIEEIIHSIEDGEMPPSGYPEVPQEELDILALWNEQGMPE